MTEVPPPEFSRPVTIADLGSGEMTLEIEAGDEERTALAARLGLLSLDVLKAKAVLKVVAGGTLAGGTLADGTLVRLTADLEAEVVQSCVLTLEPVRSGLAASFSRLYGPGAAEGGGAVSVDVGAEDPPEPVVDGTMDIGKAVTEQLCLELDPFPRATGAVFDGFSSTSGDAGGETDKEGPFAVLSRLKRDRE